VYLAHDDDWYCKLYIRQQDYFFDLVTRKIKKHIESELISKVGRKERKNFQNKERILFLKTLKGHIPEIDMQTKQELHKEWNKGLFIDLSGMQIIGEQIIIKTYIIGKFIDMDEMFNNIEQHKEKATKTNNLYFDGRKWSIS
jgi:hypothetical protein